MLRVASSRASSISAALSSLRPPSAALPAAERIMSSPISSWTGPSESPRPPSATCPSAWIVRRESPCAAAETPTRRYAGRRPRGPHERCHDEDELVGREESPSTGSSPRSPSRSRASRSRGRTPPCRAVRPGSGPATPRGRARRRVRRPSFRRDDLEQHEQREVDDRDDRFERELRVAARDLEDEQRPGEGDAADDERGGRVVRQAEDDAAEDRERAHEPLTAKTKIGPADGSEAGAASGRRPAPQPRAQQQRHERGSGRVDHPVDGACRAGPRRRSGAARPSRRRRSTGGAPTSAARLEPSPGFNARHQSRQSRAYSPKWTSLRPTSSSGPSPISRLGCAEK